MKTLNTILTRLETAGPNKLDQTFTSYYAVSSDGLVRMGSTKEFKKFEDVLKLVVKTQEVGIHEIIESKGVKICKISVKKVGGTYNTILSFYPKFKTMGEPYLRKYSNKPANLD